MNAVDFRFGDVVFETETSCLRSPVANRPIAPQPSRLLRAFLEKPGQVLTREEIRVALWGDDVHVDHEKGINFAVHQLRKVLDEVGSSSRSIETIPRVGYRWVGEQPSLYESGPVELPAVELSANQGNENQDPPPGKETDQAEPEQTRDEEPGEFGFHPHSPRPSPEPPTSTESQPARLSRRVLWGALGTAAGFALVAVLVTRFSLGLSLSRGEDVAETQQPECSFEQALGEGSYAEVQQALDDLAFPQALDASGRQLERLVDSPVALLQRAQTLRYFGEGRQVAQLVERAKEAVARCPESTQESLAARGHVLSSRSLTTATDYFRRQVALRPEDPRAAFWLASALVASGRRSEAADAVRNLVTEESSNAFVLLAASLGAIASSDDVSAAQFLMTRAKSEGNCYLEGHAEILAARSYRRGGELDRALEALDRASAAFEQTQIESDVAFAELERTLIYHQRGDSAEAAARTLGVLEVFQRLGDTQRESRALLMAADFDGSSAQAQAWAPYQTALSLVRADGNLRGEAVVLNAWAIARIRYAGEVAEAIPLFEESLALFREVKDQARIAAVTSNIGRCELLTGDLYKAALAYRQAAELEEELGLFRSLAMSRFNLGSIERELGEPLRATASLRLAREAFAELQDPRMQAATDRELAASRLSSGFVHEAQALGKRGLDQSLELGELERILLASETYAEALQLAGRPAEAEQVLLEALERASAEGYGRGEFRSRTRLLLSELAQRRDRADIESALEHLRGLLGQPVDPQRRALLLYGQLELLAGDREVGAQVLREALEFARASGRIEMALRAEASLHLLAEDEQDQVPARLEEIRTVARTKGIGIVERELSMLGKLEQQEPPRLANR